MSKMPPPCLAPCLDHMLLTEVGTRKRPHLGKGEHCVLQTRSSNCSCQRHLRHSGTVQYRRIFASSLQNYSSSWVPFSV